MASDHQGPTHSQAGRKRCQKFLLEQLIEVGKDEVAAQDQIERPIGQLFEAAHGGTSDAEMLVPLIVAQC